MRQRCRPLMFEERDERAKGCLVMMHRQLQAFERHTFEFDSSQREGMWCSNLLTLIRRVATPTHLDAHHTSGE
jgi:hypothetical protein